MTRLSLAVLAGCLALLPAAVRVAHTQTLGLEPASTIAGPANMVAAQGSRLYVVAGKTVTIVDVSKPAAPRRAGSYTFSDQIWGLTPAGSTLYVAADLFGLGVLDVSNIDAPVLRGSIKTPGQAKSVAVSGTKAVVADHVSGLDLIDLSTPARPVLVRSSFVDGFAKDVAIVGSLLYAVDMPTGFYVFDFSKAAVGEPVASLTLPTPVALRTQLQVSPATASGRRVAVVVSNGVLQVYDLSNPASPVHAATYKTPGFAVRVALDGARAYVASLQEGLQIVDLSTPSKPTIIGTHKTAGAVMDAAVNGALAFIVSAASPEKQEVVVLRRQ